MNKITLKLPEISKSLSEVRAELFRHMEESLEEYAGKGYLPRRPNLNKGVLRGLLELFAWGQFQLYRLLQKILGQVVPCTASGEWLDLHAGKVGLKRKQATKTKGKVRFYRAGSGNIAIKAGRIVSSLVDKKGQVHRFVTTADGVILEGKDWTEIPVVAEIAGSAENMVAGEIVKLVTPVAGVGRVENAANWLENEGSDVETDTALFERYQKYILGLSGVTKYAYASWALKVQGVLDVAILDKHPRGQGTVDVIILGAAGEPTSGILEAVHTEIAKHAPINDDFSVRSPEIVPCKIVGHLYFVDGDSNFIIQKCEEQIRRLFNFQAEQGFGIGQDLTCDKLTWAVMETGLVKKVDWNLTDIAVPSDGLVQLANLNLTTERTEA